MRPECWGDVMRCGFLRAASSVILLTLRTFSLTPGK